MEVNGIKIEFKKVRYLTKTVDFVSLTDLARYNTEREVNDVLRSWVRNIDTLKFVNAWEKIENKKFDVTAMNKFIFDATSNRKEISIQKLIKLTNAIGMISKSGRYGGTFAHPQIALQFCYWLEPEFQVYVIKEFEKLKKTELQSLNWDVKRIMTKANYGIMTSAVKEYLIPEKFTNSKLKGLHFASEADLINLAIFGTSSKEWKLANPDLKGNMRDHATVEQLLVLSNAQSMNAKLIEWGEEKEVRFSILNEMAIKEMQVLLSGKRLKGLK